MTAIEAQDHRRSRLRSIASRVLITAALAVGTAAGSAVAAGRTLTSADGAAWVRAKSAPMGQVQRAVCARSWLFGRSSLRPNHLICAVTLVTQTGLTALLVYEVHFRSAHGRSLTGTVISMSAA